MLGVRVGEGGGWAGNTNYALDRDGKTLAIKVGFVFFVFIVCVCVLGGAQKGVGCCTASELVVWPCGVASVHAGSHSGFSCCVMCVRGVLQVDVTEYTFKLALLQRKYEQVRGPCVCVCVWLVWLPQSVCVCMRSSG